MKLKAGDRDDSILLVAMRCLTDLLTCATHFNFRINILMAVVNRMTIRHPPQVSALCCNAIKALFEKDESGEASLEAVKLISKLIKSKNFNVQDQILRTFLHLKLSSNIHARQNEEADQAHRKKSLSKKKSQQPHISKNIKKVMKEVKEIQEEMKEAEAVVSKEEKERLVNRT